MVKALKTTAKPSKRAKAKPATKRKGASADGSLEMVYAELEKLLKRHAPPFQASAVGGARDKKSIQLTVPKAVSIPGSYGGKPVHVPIAAVILQKGYVGFYFMCVYMNEEAKKKISSALMKLLKGKACFHLKTMDEALRKDVEAAMELGTRVYKERGWL